MSKSFPSFGRRRFGAPPIVQNRQWLRRQAWLKELQKLNEDTVSDSATNGEYGTDVTDDESHKELVPVDSRSIVNVYPILESSSGVTIELDSIENEFKESGSTTRCKLPAIVTETTEVCQSKDEIVLVKSNDGETNMYQEPMNVDEVLLDSTEDEEVCEIVENDDKEDEIYDDVCVLKTDQHTKERLEDYLHNHDDASLLIEEENDPYEVLVLPDTDSDTDKYLTNIKSKIEKEGFPVNETLHLTFEETFFLMYGLGCLQLMQYDGSIFTIKNAWNHFQQQDKYFIQKYVVYHYFRSKGWVVKQGLKYGGDFREFIYYLPYVNQISYRSCLYVFLSHLLILLQFNKTKRSRLEELHRI